jgi:hypothetical protein
MTAERKIPKLSIKSIYNAFLEADKRPEIVRELSDLWRQELPGLPVPSDEQFERWLRPSYGDPKPLVFAMGRAARRMRFFAWNDPTHHLRWISAVSLKFHKGEHNEKRKAA